MLRPVLMMSTWIQQLRGGEAGRLGASSVRSPTRNGEAGQAQTQKGECLGFDEMIQLVPGLRGRRRSDRELHRVDASQGMIPIPIRPMRAPKSTIRSSRA